MLLFFQAKEEVIAAQIGDKPQQPTTVYHPFPPSLLLGITS